MRWKGRLLALIGFIAIVVSIVGAGYFLFGFFNVGASQQDPDVVAWALVRTRTASIDRHATERPPGSLDDPAMVRAGARAYVERGCVNCPGAPGVQWGKWSEGLRPDPPDLKKIVKDREPRQLFWVVKNGIRMTGMPSFSYVDDKEIWTIVAFVAKIAAVSPEDFKAWSAPTPSATPSEAR